MPMDPPCDTLGIVPRLLFRNRRRFLDLSAPGLSIVPGVCSDDKSKSLLKEGALGVVRRSTVERNTPFLLSFFYK